MAKIEMAEREAMLLKIRELLEKSVELFETYLYQQYDDLPQERWEAARDKLDRAIFGINEMRCVLLVLVERLRALASEGV